MSENPRWMVTRVWFVEAPTAAEARLSAAPGEELDTRIVDVTAREEVMVWNDDRAHRRLVLELEDGAQIEV